MPNINEFTIKRVPGGITLKLSPDVATDIMILMERLIEVVRIMRTESELAEKRRERRVLRQKAVNERKFNRAALDMYQLVKTRQRLYSETEKAAIFWIAAEKGLLLTDMKILLRTGKKLAGHKAKKAIPLKATEKDALDILSTVKTACKDQDFPARHNHINHNTVNNTPAIPAKIYGE